MSITKRKQRRLCDLECSVKLCFLEGAESLVGARISLIVLDLRGLQ